MAGSGEGAGEGEVEEGLFGRSSRYRDEMSDVRACWHTCVRAYVRESVRFLRKMSALAVAFDD